MNGKGRLPFYLALVAAVGAVGLLAAAWWPGGPEVRKAALVGVGEAVASGVVALDLKRRALALSVKAALGMMGVTFFLRLVLVGVGLVAVTRAGWSGLAFTLGFFGEYFVLQWIEVAYVLAEAKRRGQGGE